MADPRVGKFPLVVALGYPRYIRKGGPHHCINPKVSVSDATVNKEYCCRIVTHFQNEEQLSLPVPYHFFDTK